MTEWLVNHTTGMDHDAVLATLAGMNVKYSQIADPRKSPEAVVGLLKELAEDVLASEHLACFLTVTTPMETGKATVITVSRLSNFTCDKSVSHSVIPTWISVPTSTGKFRP
jgi:hypothetical protein